MINTIAIAKNVEESARLSRHRKVKGIAKQCFRNAFRVIEYVPGYEDAWYVEGVAAFGGLLTEHGWVERAWEIIDPTWPHDHMAYFPGLRFRGQAGIAEALRLPKHLKTDPDLPFFYRFGWGGRESPDFRKAWDDAQASIS
jgi:hypothetical protein